MLALLDVVETPLHVEDFVDAHPQSLMVVAATGISLVRGSDALVRLVRPFELHGVGTELLGLLASFCRKTE